MNLSRASRWIWAAATVTVAATRIAVPTLAEPAADMPACFSAAALAGKPEEKAPQKGVHTYDQMPKRTPVASFMPVPYGLRGAIRRVALADPSRKLVALTFDMCEQPGERAGYDGAIIDYLRRENVKATLFVGGKWMRSHAERFEQLLDSPQFEIGNHSEAHRNLRLLDGQPLADEIEGPQRAYEAARASLLARQCRPAAQPPERLGLFRFPYGACNPQSLAAVNDAGLLAIQWDHSTGDPSPGQSAKAIANGMIRETTPGSILIAHANGRGWHTADALPIAIPKLRAMGFEFVTVSELLASGKPETVERCYNMHPGDTDKYDHFHASLTSKPARSAGSKEAPQ